MDGTSVVFFEKVKNCNISKLTYLSELYIIALKDINYIRKNQFFITSIKSLLRFISKNLKLFSIALTNPFSLDILSKETKAHK